MKILKGMFNFLSNAVLICILGFLLIAAPMAAGYKPVMVLSGSMEPTFHVGSMIYYKSVPFDQLQVGDPITFYVGDQGTMVTHRVIEKNQETREFRTQGDANGTPDPGPVPYERVAGKASGFCIPYAGYYVSYGRRSFSIILMAAILIMNAALDKLYPDKENKKN